MSEEEIREAIAQQEEYLKRERSCGDRLGLPHRWERFSAAPEVFYEACRRCRVTRTDDDYQTKINAMGEL